MTTDNKEHLQEVLDAIEEEGIDYAFNNLSGFSNIKDEEFHRLRRAYCKAGNDLLIYLGVMNEASRDDILEGE